MLQMKSVARRPSGGPPDNPAFAIIGKRINAHKSCGGATLPMRILGQINPARANGLTASIHAITLGSAVKHIQPRFRYSFSADISSVAKLQYLLTSLIPPERNHSKLKDDAATRKVG
jgi:hypothetical protein